MSGRSMGLPEPRNEILPMGQAGKSRSYTRQLSAACYACGAKDGERHDQEAHREFVRTARG